MQRFTFKRVVSLHGIVIRPIIIRSTTWYNWYFWDAKGLMLSELAMKQRTEGCVLKSHRYPGIFKKFFVTNETECSSPVSPFPGQFSPVHVHRTYCLNFIYDWVHQAAYFYSSIKMSPVVINRTISSVISHLCPFHIPLTSLLYFTSARWSHITIFLRSEGVGLGNFFPFCTIHNLDLWKSHLTCG